MSGGSVLGVHRAQGLVARRPVVPPHIDVTGLGATAVPGGTTCTVRASPFALRLVRRRAHLRRHWSFSPRRSRRPPPAYLNRHRQRGRLPVERATGRDHRRPGAEHRGRRHLRASCPTTRTPPAVHVAGVRGRSPASRVTGDPRAPLGPRRSGHAPSPPPPSSLCPAPPGAPDRRDGRPHRRPAVRASTSPTARPGSGGSSTTEESGDTRAVAGSPPTCCSGRPGPASPGAPSPSGHDGRRSRELGPLAVSIGGHTDSVGTSAYNQDLSARRPSSVPGAGRRRRRWPSIGVAGRSPPAVVPPEHGTGPTTRRGQHNRRLHWS